MVPRSRDQTLACKVLYETLTEARSSHVSLPRFLLTPIFFSWLTQMNKEGSLGHAQLTNSPWWKAAHVFLCKAFPLGCYLMSSKGLFFR